MIGICSICDIGSSELKSDKSSSKCKQIICSHMSTADFDQLPSAVYISGTLLAVLIEEAAYNDGCIKIQYLM